MDSKNENNPKDVMMAGGSFSARSFKLLKSIGLFMAEYSIGQYILSKLDGFLWIVEKLALWSVPIMALENNADHVTNPPLVRPLPWILFFPALIALRILKGVVNMGTGLIGMETITPCSIVLFIQVKRTKLKIIRSKGMLTALMRKNMENQSLIKRLYTSISSAFCLQRLYMESNPCHKQNVEPVIVESSHNDKSETESEEHNHVKNDNTIDDNIYEIMKKIKDYAEQSSSIDEESEIDLTESDDKLNNDDDSISSTNEGDDQEGIDEDKKNSNINTASSDDSKKSTLESIAPSIKSQIIAEETEDSDVSTKGSSAATNTKKTHKSTTSIELSSNKEASSKADLESELHDENADNIDVLDELIRNSIKNDITTNGEDKSKEFINNEADDYNNLEDEKLRPETIAKNENNHVTDNTSTATTASSSNMSNLLTENQEKSSKQGLGLNLKKHKHHRRKVK